ncbi:hypothetical protein FRB95_001350 [Tulasnella sp. JGI-2019a]|nr:hypothetical protein FRB95_001350 [Tulasnella sp. JGI-2019a]
MYLDDKWTEEELRKVVDSELSAIPILLMMESTYERQECFVPVAGVNGMHELPFFWGTLPRGFDDDSKQAVVTTIYGMDLLPDQESCISVAHRGRSTLDRLNALQQLDEASKTRIVTHITSNGLVIIGGVLCKFMAKQAVELIGIIALNADPEKRMLIVPAEKRRMPRVEGPPIFVEDIKESFCSKNSAQQREQF